MIATVETRQVNTAMPQTVIINVKVIRIRFAVALMLIPFIIYHYLQQPQPQL
jgi:hypothetical protein